MVQVKIHSAVVLEPTCVLQPEEELEKVLTLSKVREEEIKC